MLLRGRYVPFRVLRTNKPWLAVEWSGRPVNVAGFVRSVQEAFSLPAASSVPAGSTSFSGGDAACAVSSRSLPMRRIGFGRSLGRSRCEVEAVTANPVQYRTSSSKLFEVADISCLATGISNPLEPLQTVICPAYCANHQLNHYIPFSFKRNKRLSSTFAAVSTVRISPRLGKLVQSILEVVGQRGALALCLRKLLDCIALAGDLAHDVVGSNP